MVGLILWPLGIIKVIGLNRVRGYCSLPVVYLQKGETCLCSDLPLLVFCWVWVLKKRRSSISVFLQFHFIVVNESCLFLLKNKQIFPLHSLSLCPYFLWFYNSYRWRLMFNLTMRCWKSQDRMMLVACLGRTPRLFFDFLSSLSRREDKSTFTFPKGKKGGGSMKGEEKKAKIGKT